LAALSDAGNPVPVPNREIETLVAIRTARTAAGFAAINELLAGLGEARPDERDGSLTGL